MIDPSSIRQLPVGRKLLDATALRHEAIATNIATRRLPFRRLDVAGDFATAEGADGNGWVSRVDKFAANMEDSNAAVSVRRNSVEMEQSCSDEQNAVEFDTSARSFPPISNNCGSRSPDALIFRARFSP